MDLNWRPNPLKAAILLEHLQIPYQVKKWVSGTGAIGVEGTEFVKINPFGRTPAIEDPNNGVLVWESGAVLNHILRTYDRDNLAGPGPTEQDRAAFDEWNDVLLTGVAPLMAELAYFRRTNEAAGVQHFETQIHRSLSVIEAHLKKSESFFVGGRFTAVDINFYPWLNLCDFVNLDITAYPNLEAWLESCKSVPAVAAALETIESGHSQVK